MSKSIGSPLWIALVWLVVGAMSLCGALCYGELAARYPEAGGGYVYLREAYGPRLAFLYGWKSFLVMDPGLTAALGIGLASYAGYIVHLSPLGTKLVALEDSSIDKVNIPRVRLNPVVSIVEIASGCMSDSRRVAARGSCIQRPSRAAGKNCRRPGEMR